MSAITIKKVADSIGDATKNVADCADRFLTNSVTETGMRKFKERLKPYEHYEQKMGKECRFDFITFLKGDVKFNLKELKLECQASVYDMYQKVMITFYMLKPNI